MSEILSSGFFISQSGSFIITTGPGIKMRRNLAERVLVFVNDNFFLSFSTRSIFQHFTQSSSSNTVVKRFLIGFAPTLRKMMNIINKLRVFYEQQSTLRNSKL